MQRKILIATGIFEPEAGGPAIFAPKLARLLTEKGWNVTVLTYSTRAEYDFDSSYPFKLVRIKRGGKIFNRIRFFFAMLRHTGDRDLIYTLDWFAVGLPVALAAKFLKKPYIVRVGGDYLWEQWYLESGARPITLFEFYARRMYSHGVYYVLYRIIRFILTGAKHVIFNSDVQKELYMRPYHLSARSVSVCYNPVPRAELAAIKRGRPNHEFVYWGRFNVMKNVTTLVRAFARAKLPDPFTLTLIGSGPQSAKILETIKELRLEKRVKMEPVMRPHEVLARIKDARAFVLPSWTDICPNQVHEALAIGLPGLVTKENYLKIHDQLPDMIDPNSVNDIAAKLKILANERTYTDFTARFKAITFKHDWSEVMDEHRAIFAAVLGKTESEVRVLQIGADRSKRGILYPDSAATVRQKAYGEKFGQLDIIGFSRATDGRKKFDASGHVHVYPTSSISPFMYGLDALEIARTLPQPDVVSVQDPFETGLAGWFIARMKRVPLHVQVHTDFLSPAYMKASFKNRLRVLLAGLVLRRATRVRVVSERIKNSITSRFNLERGISVLPIFVDLERFKTADVPKEMAMRFARFKTKLFVVSRLEHEKNVELAIRAYHEASPHDTCLIIAGEGSRRSRLERLVRDLDIVNRVFFENPDDIAPYYKLADLVLVSSKYEGYGLATIEALAAGKPVLSTDVGIAREAGAIVTSEEKFANALAAWFKSGPREGHLNNYPYKNFDEYVRAYCDDIRTCTKER